MKMYAIIDKYNEGFYFNFENDEFTMFLNEKCLLPSVSMAEHFIEDYLCEDNKLIEVDIYNYENGNITYSTNEHEFFNNKNYFEEM